MAVSQPLTPEPDRLTSEEAGLVPQLLNPEQVGAVTGQHPKTILAAFNRGDLARIRLGPRTVRFHPDDVQSYIDAHRTSAVAQ